MTDASPHQLDWLVLTAANESQAETYRAQLTTRDARGQLPRGCRWLVVPDTRGVRIGSGSSTLLVLHELAKRLHADNPAALSITSLFRDQRILVIHSGGDSRRLPSYAALGKVFTPVPRETASSDAAAVFDLVLEDLLHLTTRPGGSVLVATGDVVLGVAEHALELAGAGIIGVAVPASLAQGRRHGVYVRGQRGEVVDFLQKPSASEARAAGALISPRRVLLDTGLLSLDPETVAHWLRGAGAAVSLDRRTLTVGNGMLSDLRHGTLPPLDLFLHVLCALPPRVDRDQYIARCTDDATPADIARTLLRVRSKLRGPSFRVETVPRCAFLHMGSPRELLDHMTTPDAGERRIGLQSVVASLLPARTKAPSPRVVTNGCDLSAARLRGAPPP